MGGVLFPYCYAVMKGEGFDSVWEVYMRAAMFRTSGEGQATCSGALFRVGNLGWP